MDSQFSALDGQNEEEAVAQYARLVRSIIRPYFLQGGDVDDLYQEGMIGLLKAVRAYDVQRSPHFEPYAAACIRNQIVDAVRRQARNGVKDVAGADGRVRIPESTADDILSDPETEVLASESAREIKKALSGLLSALEASVLDPYLQGYTASEIAIRLHRPAKSVDNAIRRIRRKFAQVLSQGDSRNYPVRIKPNPQKGTKER